MGKRKKSKCFPSWAEVNRPDLTITGKPRYIDNPNKRADYGNQVTAEVKKIGKSEYLTSGSETAEVKKIGKYPTAIVGGEVKEHSFIKEKSSIKKKDVKDVTVKKTDCGEGMRWSAAFKSCVPEKEKVIKEPIVVDTSGKTGSRLRRRYLRGKGQGGKKHF